MIGYAKVTSKGHFALAYAQTRRAKAPNREGMTMAEETPRSASREAAGVEAAAQPAAAAPRDAAGDAPSAVGAIAANAAAD